MKISDKEEKRIKQLGFPEEVQEAVLGVCDINNFKRHIQSKRKLAAMGEKALPYMHQLMDSEDYLVRREATRVVEKIADPESIPVLLERLRDEESDIHWMAGEALVKIGRKSIEPLLKTLIEDHGSYKLRTGAHYVLSVLSNDKDPVEMQELIKSLKPGVEIPEKILENTNKALRSGKFE